MDRPTAELALDAGARLVVIEDPDGRHLQLQSDDAGDPTQKASRWLVDHLTGGDDTLSDKGFQLKRFAGRAASPPAGERTISAEGAHRSIVVGEQAVVKWLDRVDEIEHPALRTLTHLAEVGFDGAVATWGALTWTSPSGLELPCAFVTEFVTGAVDGWTWCVAAVESADRPDFPAELGRLTARLHVALGSGSTLLPLPMLATSTAQIRRWHSDARLRLDELAERVGELDNALTGPDGDRPGRRPTEALAEYRPRLEAVIDRLLEVSGRTPVQLVHGDLHVGRVLDAAGGLTVINLEAGASADRQPAARDVARILVSLEQVGRIVDRRSGYTRTAEIDEWSITARIDFLLAYRAELNEVERRDVLDVRLLASFLAEQTVRDLLYALRHRPRWAGATIDGLESLLTELPLEGREPDGSPAPDSAV